jgi:probable DNA metabolism protein
MEVKKDKEYVQCLTDGSFEGLLTAIFDCYANKVKASNIVAETQYQPGLFGRIEFTRTDLEKAKRVSRKLKQIDISFFKTLYCIFLSEHLKREMLIYNLVAKMLRNPEQVKGDYRDAEVLRAKEIRKEVGREVHRMHAFVRFQRMADDIWFAAIKPDFDVIPLIGDHFEKRYADQKWVIYDVKRSYGLSYDLEKMEYVELDFTASLTPEKLNTRVLHKDEIAYQTLWQEYFKSVDIASRRNMKLHIRHVPKRYWRYMMEKW